MSTVYQLSGAFPDATCRPEVPERRDGRARLDTPLLARVGERVEEGQRVGVSDAGRASAIMRPVGKTVGGAERPGAVDRVALDPVDGSEERGEVCPRPRTRDLVRQGGREGSITSG